MSFEVDLRSIEEQERELQFSTFDMDSAWSLGVRLRDLAVQRSYPVAIDVRRFGQPLFYCALAGSTPDNADWVRRKSNVVARFLQSSYRVGLGLKRANNTLAEKFGLASSDYAAHGGAFPIGIKGSGAIGSVTVSGLPQRDDHELVVEALCAELGVDYRTFALIATNR